jgi:hypothetical protein
MKLTLGHVECAIQIDRHLGERNEREYKTFFPVPGADPGLCVHEAGVLPLSYTHNSKSKP